MIRSRLANYLSNCNKLDSMKKTCGFADYTALMYWSDDELEELGRLSVEYSGNPISNNELVTPTQNEMSVEKISREFDDLKEYNAPEKKCSTSWATAAVKAAEAALDYRVELSAKQLMECLPKDMGFADGCDGVHPKKVMDYLLEEGLVAKDDFTTCDALDGLKKYYFTPNTPEVPTAGGLMNFLVTENKPVFVMVAVNLQKLMFVKNMTDIKDSVKCGGYQPSLYGVLTGYKYYDNSKSGWWEVVTHIVPGEEVTVKMPITSNMYNANYAGIAAYAFTLSEVMVCGGDLVISSDDECDRLSDYVTWRSLTVNADLCGSVTSDLVIANSPCLEEVTFKTGSVQNINSVTISNNEKLNKINAENGAFRNAKSLVMESMIVMN